MRPREPSGGVPRVTVLTHIVTPYQVELFDAVNRRGAFDLRVVYLTDSRAHRGWQRPRLEHPSVELAAASPADVATAQRWTEDADLLVAGHYRHGVSLRWMEERERAGRAWCLWGERPGVRSAGLAGRAFRAWKLRVLSRSRAPIWGIGKWAVAGWEREFGTVRRYFNMPYFSDLRRFSTAAAARATAGRERRFLFSGSLIKRKGVDLLARGFARIAKADPHVTLDLVGSGPLQPSLERVLAPYSQRVRFHGFQQWAELPGFYAQADILCVPSRYDGWGLVIPEGLASRMPVIATDRMGSAIELMTSGANGWVARAGDAASLEEGLAAAAALGEADLQRMRDAAAASVERHGLEAGVSRFEMAVDETLSAWGADSNPTYAGREAKVPRTVP